MISNLQVTVLALIQGFTEFLPISSSAHLILCPWFFNWPDQGLLFDIVVHVGTLTAVIFYFRATLFKILRDASFFLVTGEQTKYTGLFINLIVATIPVGIAGIIIKLFFASYLRSEFIIAIATIFFGLLLWLADRYSYQVTEHKQINLRNSVIIGLSQALALIPGASRSGVTLTAGLFCGYDRERAAEFSFLLSIPVIILAGLLESIELLSGTAIQSIVSLPQLILGFLIAAFSGYVAILGFMRLLSKFSLKIFVVYRILLGIILLYYIS